MFQQLKALNEDPILGLMARFRADPDPRKVDLGVGVYRDPAGNTPVLDCVRRAEQAIIAGQTTKAYVAAAGRAEFNDAVTSLVLGDGHAAVSDRRCVTVQTPGGCGALRVGAELIRAAAPATRVHVSDPSWGNHMPLLGSSGLQLERYPYYDAPGHRLRIADMLERLELAAAGDIVLLHACCHNPTGADLEPAQWDALTGVLQRRGLVPFLDLAYQGFGTGLLADVEPVRRIAAQVPEVLVAVSFSKNLGLYRERVGALICIAGTAAGADVIRTHVLQIGRSIYSMPPDHGAAIAARIFADPALASSWHAELESMRMRIVGMRALLADRLKAAGAAGDFDFLRAQRGMFSLLGVSGEQVAVLRDKHHVYMTADSRMNLAGVMPGNADYLAEAIAAVLETVS
ncbi:MAG: aromatic amino acid transaminase [Steroidobacterales bacterium]